MRLHRRRHKLQCSELFFLLYPVVAVQEHPALTLERHIVTYSLLFI